MADGNVVLTTEPDPVNPNPDKIRAAYRVAEGLQQRIGGTAQSVVMEAALAIPTTAHILGGAVIGRDPSIAAIPTNAARETTTR